MTEIHITIKKHEHDDGVNIKLVGSGKAVDPEEIRAGREIIEAVNAVINKHPHINLKRIETLEEYQPGRDN